MKRFNRSAPARNGFEVVGFYLLAAILLFAPLIKGGNRPLPLLTLELAALLLLVLPLLRPVFVERLPKFFLFALALMALWPLLQLLPLPFSLWTALPGREIYADAVAAFGASGASMRPLSIVPRATESAWLALLPPLAVFLVVVSLNESALRKIVYLFIAMAAVQAIVALVQFGGGASTTFRTSLSDIGTAVGTYVNRNHLASLLVTALPVALGVLVSRIGRSRETLRYRSRSMVKRISEAFSQPSRMNQAMLFGAVCIALLLGIVFSRSRSGISLALLGVLLSAVFFGLKVGGKRSTKLAILLSVGGLVLALQVGLAPVLERFSVEGALEDARWGIYGSSMAAVALFFPFGSGIGSFPEVYRRFQPEDIPQFVNHAHNDYIEYLFEGGLVAAVVLVLFAVMYLRTWPRLLKLPRWGTLSYMQAGAGLGLLLMALHGLTEYNWHIPANAIYFALMAGVFVHRGEAEPERARTSKKPGASPRSEAAPPVPLVPPVPVVRPVMKNPFAD
jgi:O-antigen ligase